MEDTYEIYPIVTCKLINDQGHFTYRVNYGKTVLFPVYTWLLRGAGKTVLVDATCSNAEMKKYSSGYLGGEEGTPLEDSPQKLGVMPADIKTIILTHMHFDHILGANRFPNARIIIQEEELKFANDPHPLFSKFFNKDFHGRLNWETVNGDARIMSGIEVIFTPGHSPGNQSVLVNTEKGKVAITGYCTIDENFGEKGDIVVGMHTDLFDAYASNLKLRKMCQTLIPLHSQSLLPMKQIPS